MKKLLHVFALTTFGLVICSCGPQEPSNTSATSVEPTETVAPNLVGKEVTYASGDVSLKGYIAYDENQTKKRPGILVVHEWWGHNDYVRKRADMLAEQGYVAMAVDMYGDGKVAEHPNEAMKESGMIVQDMDLASRRFEAARKVLLEDPHVDPGSISAVGYCFGGSIAMAMANGGADLDGVAAFHSGVQLPIAPSKDLKAKVLVQNGADDPFISAESVENFKAAMDSVGADYEYIAYPGAVHAFTNPDADAVGEKYELPLKYQKEADEKSWEQLQEFFKNLYP